MISEKIRNSLQPKVKLTSSYGEVWVDRITGEILLVNHYQEDDPYDYLDNIVRFDIEQLKLIPDEWEECDIVAIGDWNKEGIYSPPALSYELKEDKTGWETKFGDL